MDDIQDWLQQINIEMWQRRIRQLRQELREEKNQSQRSPSPPTEVSPPKEVGERSRTAQPTRRGDLNEHTGV